MHRFVFLFATISICIASNLTNVDRLYKTLQTDYNKYVRPLETTTSPVIVNVTFILVGVKEFDEVNGMFSVTGAFLIRWKDPRLAWEPSSYGDVQSINFPERKVWIPSLSLLNPYVSVERIAKGIFPVTYSSDGSALWMPADVMSSRCEVDVTNYPFDTQTCRMLFGCWGYPSSSIVVQAPDPKFQLSYFIKNDTWEIINHRMNTVTDNFLTYVSIDMTMKRHPAFALINTVVPMIFMVLMNMFVFIIPLESGERLSFAVTVLLAIAVFLTIVETSLPPTSDPIAILSYLILSDLVISTFICFVVIVGIALYHKDSENTPVPEILSTIVKFVCYRKKASAKSESDDESDEEVVVTWKMLTQCIDKIMLCFCSLFVILTNILFFALTAN